MVRVPCAVYKIKRNLFKVSLSMVYWKGRDNLFIVFDTSISEYKKVFIVHASTRKGEIQMFKLWYQRFYLLFIVKKKLITGQFQYLTIQSFAMWCFNIYANILAICLTNIKENVIYREWQLPIEKCNLIYTFIF